MEIENKVKGSFSGIHQAIHESSAMSCLHDFISDLLAEKNVDAKFTVTVKIDKTKSDDTLVNDEYEDQDDDFDE